MKYRRTLAAFAVAVVVIGFWTVSSSNSKGASQTFLETFDGSPSSPTAWNGSNWDVAVHTRSQETWDAMSPTMAMHGSDCGAPPATHTVNSYSGADFQCKDHVMTTMNDGGYGAVYLAPDAMADFSGGTAVVKFDAPRCARRCATGLICG